jgi:2-oxoisovalerate dehydrogenase E1 component
MKKEEIQYQVRGIKWSGDVSDIKKTDRSLLARMLFDIQVISKFEESILRLKNEGCIWGPVHTSIGQEAIAAGTVAALRPSDKFFGTHRSHHQFIAKALQYVVAVDWDPARQVAPEAAKTVIRKTLAEIMGLSEGYCGGRGGSMHLRWKEAGFLGSNAIVAGGIPPATGAAFHEKFNNTGNVVVAFFGDGAINQGAFHEACNLAALWKLPVVFFLENNEYAVATSIKDACAVSDLSAQAVSYGMNAHVVEGHDIMAVYNMIKEVSNGIRGGEGPCLVVAKCYRRYHHAGDLPGSAFKYRSKEEEKHYMDREVVSGFPRLLMEEKILNRDEVDRVISLAAELVDDAVQYYTEESQPCRIKTSFYPVPATASEGFRSDGREFKDISFSEPKNYVGRTQIKYSDAIAASTKRWMEKDPGVFVLGEEVANFGGGAYGATKGLPEKYPDRILNTPISEAGFTGLALGAAMSGMKPIVEIMFPDFTLVAADQIFNQIGKARHMYGNTTDIPLVLRTRIAIGCGYGGQHSMDPVGLYALFSGWRIVAPSNAADYIGLFNTAMQSLDPVLILEHHALYTQSFTIPENNMGYYIEFGKASVVGEGSDVTLVTYGYMAYRIEKLLHTFKEQGISVELIDLRTLDLPSIDFQTIGTSLKKTGVAVVVEEAQENLSIGGKIAAEITERYFDYLDSPVMRLTSLDVPNSVSKVLEDYAMLADETIIRKTVQAARRQWK